MSRNVCVTAVDGNTGFVTAELLLTDENFSKEFSSVTGLALNPDAERCRDLAQLGAKIVPCKLGKLDELVGSLQSAKADTICVIPPAHGDKVQITSEFIEAAKKANVPNAVFLSAAGCDLAERDKQPRLREFIDLETRFMQTKGDASTRAGYSPVVIRYGYPFLFHHTHSQRAFPSSQRNLVTKTDILMVLELCRAGFYAENLLLYSPQAKEKGALPLPVGRDHKFPPVSLGVSETSYCTSKT